MDDEPEKQPVDAKDFVRKHQRDLTLHTLYTGRKGFSDVQVSDAVWAKELKRRKSEAGTTSAEAEASPEKGPLPVNNDLVLLSLEPRIFPGIHERQETLTQAVVDVGMQIVFETLLHTEMNYTKIRQTGLIRNEASWAEVVTALNTELAKPDPNTQKPRKPLLVTDRLKDAVTRLGAQTVSDVLKSHNLLGDGNELLGQIALKDLIPFNSHPGAKSHEGLNPHLESFFSRRAELNYAKDSFRREQLAYNRDRLAYRDAMSDYDIAYQDFTASQMSDTPHDEPKRPTPPRVPVQPVYREVTDPRIERFNALFGEYLKIAESGAKLWESSAMKLHREDGLPMSQAVSLKASDLRDANRITLLPTRELQAERMTHLLSQRFRTFSTGQKFRPGGHFDQKIYIAPHEAQGGAKGEDACPVAEIKIETEKVHAAHRVSHGVYKCMKELETCMSPQFSELPPDRRKEYMHTVFTKYRQQVRAFKNSPTLCLPQPCDPERFERPGGLAFCYGQLLGLHRSIYVNAMRKAPVSTQRTYIQAALRMNEDAKAANPDNPGFPEALLEKINPELFAKVRTEFQAAETARIGSHGRD